LVEHLGLEKDYLLVVMMAVQKVVLMEYYWDGYLVD
jgi:hypothetical protein